MVTINDIAKIVGVDKSTVSRALNDSERISKKVRDKIKKIAKDLKYYPNASAYSLRKKVNRSIAVVLPELRFPGGEFFQEVLRGIDAVIQPHFFTLLFTTYSKEDDSFFRIVQENRVDGALVIGDVFSLEDLRQLNEVHLPTFIVNYKLNNHAKNLIDIYSDNELGGEIVAEHLIDIHKRKNILYIGGGDKYQANVLRKKGLENVVKKYKSKGKNINVTIKDGDFATSFKCGREITEELINNNKFNFDAIFAASDSLAIGAYKVLLRKGIHIPKDVSLIAYDNIEIDSFFPVSITSVDQNAYLIGKHSAEILMNRILKKDTELKQGIIIEPELIIRSSCGCDVNDF